jgi:hypothetical protein
MLLPNFVRVDPLSDFTPDQLLAQSVHHDLKIGDETLTKVAIRIDLDLSALEAWCNKRALRLPYEQLAEALAHSEFKDLLMLPDSSQILHTHTALIARGLRLPELVRYHFKINEHTFSSYDCLFHALARSIADPKCFRETRLIEFCEGDVPRAPVVVPLEIEPSVLVSFRLLALIHRLAPEFEVKRAEFANQIFGALSSPLLTIGFHSLQSRIFYHFPFLFDFSMRRVFFQIVGFDLSCSLPCINSHFYQVRSNARTNQMRVKANVHKCSIYDDGVRLLRIAGPGVLRIDVFFDDEQGIGFGPTQEFFDRFARELCAKRLNLWRDDSRGDGPCVHCVHCAAGLFPLPRADPEHFYLLGLLCGKALMMDMLVPLPFNPAFFRLVLGEQVAVADVDAALARARRSRGTRRAPVRVPRVGGRAVRGRR